VKFDRILGTEMAKIWPWPMHYLWLKAWPKFSFLQNQDDGGRHL